MKEKERERTKEKDQGPTGRNLSFLLSNFYFLLSTFYFLLSSLSFIESVGRTNFFLLQIKEGKFEMNQT